ncbi:transposable element Tcb2 transposase [Trichonephila clavipes]|nr:transposable element Tcb2 transposase [Trichonephila clavipes]
MNPCSTVLFTDEVRFGLIKDYRHTFIWKNPGIRFLPPNVQEIYQYGSRGLMAWESIQLDDRSQLHVIKRGIVTAVRYREEVLEHYA